LAIPHNAFPGRAMQTEFQSWAEVAYPELWKQLEKKGRKMSAVTIQDMVVGERSEFKVWRTLRVDDSYYTDMTDDEVEGDDRIPL
jgi:hypothetical protein